MEDLLSVVIGALLAAGAGFVGAWIQGRREHARWLREQRYEAYRLAIDAVSTALAIGTEVVATVRLISADEIPEAKREAVAARLTDRMARADALSDALAERLAPLVILGPKAVGDAYVAVIDAMDPVDQMDVDQVKVAESALSAAMRKALGVADY